MVGGFNIEFRTTGLVDKGAQQGGVIMFQRGLVAPHVRDGDQVAVTVIGEGRGTAKGTFQAPDKVVRVVLQGRHPALGVGQGT